MVRSWALYVVTDESLSQGRSHLECARAAVEGGADVVQLRDKRMSARELLGAAEAIRANTAGTKTLFLVNDRFDIALAAGADGVHLGQDDLPVSAARRCVPASFVIGVSVGSVEEALRAERAGADYVAVSPVFATGSKADAGPGHGLATVEAVRSAVSVPVLAIGGIGPSNAAAVIRAGADGCAVISAVVSQPDMAEAARTLREIILSEANRGQPKYL
jgi:thiamine-phosphate pyrophosphorylase